MNKAPVHSTPNRMTEALAGYALPTFSTVVLMALEKLRDPSCTAEQVGDVLENDPGISAKLMGFTNSACFGLNRPANSASHAVALLGRDQVESLLFSAAVNQALPVDPIPALNSAAFWCAAARRSAIARRLAEHIDPANARESFTTALLQDMAVPLLARVHGAAYGELLTRSRNEGLDLAVLEREQFGWDHAMVGAWMGQQWRFSDRAVRALGAHHGIWEETDLAAVTLVGCLNDAESNYGQERLLEQAQTRYGLSSESLQRILVQSEIDAADMARMFV